MRIALCDDSSMEREQLTAALHSLDGALSPVCFSDGASLLQAAGQQPGFELVFLDIYLPGEDGIEVARRLRALSPGTAIVFLTVSREHAVEAFALDALHYLVKPVTVQGVAEALGRLAQRRGRSRPTITLALGHDSVTVSQEEITCIESAGHAKEVRLADGRCLRVWQPMDALAQRLDGRFLRLGRGILVNMDCVETLRPDLCILRDGTRLPVPRRERSAIRAAYDQHLFSRLSGRAGGGGEESP